MKIGKTSLLQKSLIVLLTVMLVFNFINPLIVRADDDEDGGSLADPIMKFICFLGDGIMNTMQKIFMGQSNAINKSLSDEVASSLFGVALSYKWIYLPNYLITPEKIFSGDVPAFDINFFNPAPAHTETVEGNANENIASLKELLSYYDENTR